MSRSYYCFVFALWFNYSRMHKYACVSAEWLETTVLIVVYLTHVIYPCSVRIGNVDVYFKKLMENIHRKIDCIMNSWSVRFHFLQYVLLFSLLRRLPARHTLMFLQDTISIACIFNTTF